MKSSANDAVRIKRAVLVFYNRVMVISAKSAILLEGESFRCIYEKGAHRKLPCASTTKILTALITLHKTKPHDLVYISRKAAKTPFSSLSLIGSKMLPVNDLLHLLLLSSDNGAAVSLAQHISKNERKFTQLMNAYASEIGCTSSSFRNPHGLPQLMHYSSAFDLALIERQALNYKGFLDITRKASHIINTNDERSYTVYSNNPFLNTQGFLAVKTGWTRKAGHCLVCTYNALPTALIIVVLGCPTKMSCITDTMKLVTYARSVMTQAD